ncbi:MAG TPA: DUF554 domain-containing protein [bacterium]|nr:DUF554 domain-containing protein [bacterium]
MYLGTIVNALAALVGGTLGAALRRRIPERMRDIAMQGIGLVTLVLGMQMALGTRNILAVILSVVAGGWIGEWLGIEGGLERLGAWAEARFGGAGERGTFARAFVTSSLLFCVGPLTILGSLQAGLGGSPTLLYTKSLLDGVSALAIGAALGIGVVLSAGTILVYQGALTLLAKTVQSVMTPAITREFAATGGVLVLGIGLTILRVRVVRAANLLPALLVVVVLTALAPALAALARSLGLGR